MRYPCHNDVIFLSLRRFQKMDNSNFDFDTILNREMDDATLGIMCYHFLYFRQIFPNAFLLLIYGVHPGSKREAKNTYCSSVFSTAEEVAQYYLVDRGMEASIQVRITFTHVVFIRPV